MRIVVLCEGKTEAAIKNGLREFVQRQSAAVQRTGIKIIPLDGPVLRKKLCRLVKLYTSDSEVRGVVALTDVYPDYEDAVDAKRQLVGAVAGNDGAERFRAHAAQFDIEAWLMPFWTDIAKSLGVKAKIPGVHPERINGSKPPSHHLKELYLRAKNRYEKKIDGPKWLTADRLEKAAESCPELKSFLNTLIELAGGEIIA